MAGTQTSSFHQVLAAGAAGMGGALIVGWSMPSASSTLLSRADPLPVAPGQVALATAGSKLLG